MRSWLTPAVALALLSGCLVHERELDAAPLPDHADPRVDAFRAEVPDADLPDVGALPVEPELDGAVDEPPDAWVADGAVPQRVQLDPVGMPVPLDDTDDHQGGEPNSVWNGAGWGLAWAGVVDTRLRVLDADGVPTRPSVAVAPSAWPGNVSLDFAIGRYAVLIDAPGRPALYLADRDERVVPRSTPISPTTQGDVARLEGTHQWIVATRGLDGRSIVVEAIDDDMQPARDVVTLALPEMGFSDADVRVAAIKTRVAVVWTTPSAVSLAVFTGGPLTQIGGVIDLGVAGGVRDREDLKLEIEGAADRMALAIHDGAHVDALFVDPFGLEVRGPFPLGPTGITDRRAGVAPAREHELVGVCWARGAGPGGGSPAAEDGVSIQVVGLDGTPLSAPLALVSGLTNIGGVDCGWDGSDFVVIWWRAGVDNQLFSQRVHPTFS